jgi:heme/copper-type cytochrome/quinol oxidase subunit 4
MVTTSLARCVLNATGGSMFSCCSVQLQIELACFLYLDYDLIVKNLSMMNKYSELD